tara:strand:- start:93 stop:410 length:318 start_codon:yes stop_codon:yes gene_type:complete
MYYLDYATVNGSNYLCSTISNIEASSSSKLAIFPNPSKSIINVNNLNNDYNLLVITNINGSSIKQIPLLGLLNITVDIDKMDNGMYFLHFFNKKGVVTTQKFIKN